MICFTFESELTSVCENWEADDIICKAPSCLVQFVDGVSKQLQGFEDWLSSAIHDVYVVCPKKSSIEEKSQMSQGVSCLYSVVSIM